MTGVTIASSITEIISITPPKESLNGGGADAAADADASKPLLVIDPADLPQAAKGLRDIFANSNRLFDRGGPTRIAYRADEKVPVAVRLNNHGVVRMAHELCQPARYANGGLERVTLPERVAALYLDMDGEWNLLPLASISTAPILAADGTIQSVEGYQPAAGVFCCNLPKLDLPERPTRAQAEAALRLLRQAFRTFPFSDAKRKTEDGVEVIDPDQQIGYDESGFLCSLLTAICRQSLWLAPGLLLSAPSISGAGTGKGLLVRCIATIAYGMLPRAFPPRNDRHEMDKRLVAEVIQGNPICFMDNVNGAVLRSDTLASFLTERPAQVRILGRSQMVRLEAATFFAIAGNGLALSEDLARRFICVELDARVEDPEQRPFAPGFLKEIKSRRADLLAAGLTILRWGRQNIVSIKRGKALGSFESWSEWVRDPLVELGACDPVDRVNELKARDPERQRIISLFNAWDGAHGDDAVKVSDLAESVQAVADPNGRGRQYLAREIGKLAGTRLAGFFLERQEEVNHRKEGARYRLTRLRSGQNPSASSASSAPPGPDAGHGADAAGDADAFQLKPKACAHCDKVGELLECSVGGEAALLHRACIDLWEKERR
jgi:hypothetical protein